MSPFSYNAILQHRQLTWSIDLDLALDFWSRSAGMVLIALIAKTSNVDSKDGKGVKQAC